MNDFLKLVVMKFTHSRKMSETIGMLFKTLEENEANAEAFNAYLSARSKAMFDNCEKAYKAGFSPKDAFIDEAEQYLMKSGIDIRMDKTRNSVAILNPKEFEDDPYWRSIHFPAASLGEWKLSSSSYAPFEAMLSDEIVVKEGDYFKEINKLGLFLKEFRYIEVQQNGKTWMSVTPHEINTMKEAIKKAEGKVVTFGLGLGYYPFSVSLKDSVSSVTIIEKDERCIGLFNKFILPQFPHKSKISVINCDAYQFATKMKDGDFDYSFVDIWHLPFDGLFSYLRFVPHFFHFEKTKTSYWIEKSILSLLRRALLILVEEEYGGKSDIDYQNSKNETDFLINGLHFLLKDTKIESASQLMRLLSDDSLRSLAGKKPI